MITRGSVDDIMDVYDLLRPFFDEGHWRQHGSINTDNVIKYIYAFLDQGDVFISRDDKGLNGIIVSEICYEFLDRPACYVTNFYTAPRIRGKGIARELFDIVIKNAQDHKAYGIYSMNCGIFTSEANALFGNLCKKFAFNQVSTVYFRGL